MAIRCAVAGFVLLALAACRTATPPAADEVAVRVDSVGMDAATGSPVVVLVEDAGSRRLPIWIGFAEAASIAAEVARQRPPRPNTHDLLLDVIGDLEGRVERAVVTELRDGTYYAVLHVATRGRHVEIDARPSDAVAIALRASAPLFVRAALFDAARQAPAGSDAPSREARQGAPGNGIGTGLAQRNSGRAQRTGSSCAARTGISRRVAGSAPTVGDVA